MKAVLYKFLAGDLGWTSGNFTKTMRGSGDGDE
jgi:hypothetical protein